MRDEFENKTKDILAKRVGFLCSNPDCQRTTTGPSTDPRKSVNIGVAAHISAASPGGPRYNPNLSPEERKSPENGIWLCQICSKLVDSDPQKYTSETLYTWKTISETRSNQSIQGIIVPSEQAGVKMSTVVLANQLDQIGVWASNEIEQNLERMQVACREGHESDAANWLKNLRNNNDLWLALPQNTKAKILNFEIVLELEITGKVDRAKQLLNEVQTLTPSYNQTRLQALIAYKEKGHEDAIQLLAGQNDIDSINLKASLLLEMGSIDKCREELSKIENYDTKPNAETFRIYALLYRVTKDISKAQLEIQKAQELEPRWKSIRFNAAVIDYFSAISPIAVPEACFMARTSRLGFG